jgi:hypothetical protein
LPFVTAPSIPHEIISPIYADDSANADSNVLHEFSRVILASGIVDGTGERSTGMR